MTGLSTSTGYVGAGGFNPNTEAQIFAVDVTDGSGQATIAELYQVLAAINGTDGEVLPSFVLASLTSPVFNPFGSQYNLFLTFSGNELPPGLGTPAYDFLGIDLSGASAPTSAA